MTDPSDGDGTEGRSEMGAPGAQFNRRTTLRRKVSDLACVLRVGGVDHNLEIGDISEVGLQGETDVSVHSGQRVEIVLPAGELVRATVRWGVGPYVGVEFDHAIVVPVA